MNTLTESITHQKSASHLSKDDWLDAAFNAVVEGGFDKAKVLMLSKQLGVTRGSFYWHFVDHADLIKALLARWQNREVLMVQQLLADQTKDAMADLERLLDAAMVHAGEHLEYVRFELALRGLGRRDATVAKLLTDIDQLRLNLFTQKFERLSGDSKQAADFAALFYLTLVGSNQALSRPDSTQSHKAYLKHIITQYVIKQSHTQ